MCSCGTKAGATDSHSSLSALIREMMGKHTDSQEGALSRLPNGLKSVHRRLFFLWESRHYLCFLKRCCVGYEIWACSDQIQLSPPLLPSTQPLPLHSPGFYHCLCLYSNKRRRRRQQFLFSLPLIGPWPRTKSTFKLQHTLNNVISNTRSKNKMTRCPNIR